MSTVRRIAVVGAGVIGTHHALVVHQLAGRLELAAVVDGRLDRAERLAAARGGRAFPSLTAALASADVDLVAVCTPTGRHGEAVLEALDAGKHVVVEKPAETTPARIDALIAARDRAGRLVSVVSQHRFDPSTQAVLAAVRDGSLGRLTSAVASIAWWRGQDYYDAGGWRGTWALDGGGALMNQGVHTVDLLVAVMGRPVEVFAYTGTLAHERIEVEDVAVGVVRFESGALGVLHATTAAHPGLSARLQVHGDRGSAVIDDDRLVALHRTPTGPATEPAISAATGPPPEGSTEGSTARDPGALSDAHRLQYLNVLAALDGTEELRVGLEANRQAVSVITGVYESARTGRPVRLE